MARPMRIEYPGALYHITTRGNARRAIFKDDRDRRLLLDILQRIADRYHWLCHAYCLMDNHYHLVVETPDGHLAHGMRQLNGVYTQAYNRRHRRAGHLFQDRYKAILIDKESYLLEVCRYVVLNPVRAKAVEHPGKWKWSSYGATAGIAKSHPALATDWVLGQFGERRSAAEQRYREFVREGAGGETIHDKVIGQSLLGTEKFIERLIGRVRGREEIKEIPKRQRFLGRPTLKELFAAQGNKEKRNKKIADAVLRHGYSQMEVAEQVGMHYSTISRIIKISKFKT
ncbi:MAG TPA: transposase [Candidatus Binatia bacterium]|jgi:REP element-mobilizing transposase RayT